MSRVVRYQKKKKDDGIKKVFILKVLLLKLILGNFLISLKWEKRKINYKVWLIHLNLIASINFKIY